MLLLLYVHALICPAHTNVMLVCGKWSSGSPVTSEVLLWWERPRTLWCLCSHGVAALKCSVFDSLWAHPTCFKTAFPLWDQTWVCFWVKPHKIQCGCQPALCCSHGVPAAVPCFRDQSFIALRLHLFQPSPWLFHLIFLWLMVQFFQLNKLDK